LIVGQVAVGSLVSDLFLACGLRPKAGVGYSMGETTALVSLGAWSDRDEMLRRISESPLFHTDLAGPCHVARRYWNLPDSASVDWVAGITLCSENAAKQAIGDDPHVFVLIVNSQNEIVLGGRRRNVESVVRRLNVGFLELPAVSTVHCPIGGLVENAYRELHDLPTIPVDATFYSGVWGRPYLADRREAAGAITAQAAHRIDFPAVVERAYADGIRVFLEMGPGYTVSRLIGRILEGKPHVAISACRPDQNASYSILTTFAELVAHRVPVSLDSLFEPIAGDPVDRTVNANPAAITHAGHKASGRSARSVRVPIRRPPFDYVDRPGRVVGVQTNPTRCEISIPETRPETPFTTEWINPRSEPTWRKGEGVQLSNVAASLSHGEDVGDLPMLRGSREEPEQSALTSSETILPGEPALSSESHCEAGSLARQLSRTVLAEGQAHEQFLATSAGFASLLASQIERQQTLIADLASAGLPDESADVASSMGRDARISFSPQSKHDSRVDSASLDPIETTTNLAGSTTTVSKRNPDAPRPWLDRDQCLEFAVGSIAKVLGPEFEEVDRYPTRVRLPDEPLMLVDRIVLVEGEPRSLRPGRLVTEHDVKEGDWYLDAGRIAPSIAIESGQADLFLSGYLGIDFETKGLAVYRLLDAAVTFHRGLPGPDTIIRYDIRISQFFRQEKTYLFRFEFEATVDGEPLLTMKDGCAGFFTAQELADGRGIVPRPLDQRPVAGIRPADWKDLVPSGRLALDRDQVEALRQGNLAAAFGQPFDRLRINKPLPLPGGRMRLVHRVPILDPAGGRFGLGLIRAEADIQSDDWFMVCHFVDDRVMPGTLMYESCLHTLRIFLMRMGWVGPVEEVAFEPTPGVANRLRCRGQVIESTRTVAYEVTIKELGFGPEPYAVADALMYADGKPIVEVLDMSLRLTGSDRPRLQAIWADLTNDKPATVAGSNLPGTRLPALFEHDRILAFATGKPSAAFGEPYRIFDDGRFIARLPAPPYQFLHRILEATSEPWRMQAGGTVVAEYDVPPDAWYFDADRQDRMPYAVLLEIALQACGWTSAYMGSALQSDGPLKYRNLGGEGRQLAPITRNSGTLTTRLKVTKVNRSAGMILQHFDFVVSDRNGPVYEGTSYFGFFHPDSLAEQVGIREASWYQPPGRSIPGTPSDQIEIGQAFPYPAVSPYPDASWRMVDRVDKLLPQGGPAGLGFIEGSTTVNPTAWFFQAHFLQDPVWPGSLGLESLLQLLKVLASSRWGESVGSLAFESVGLNDLHRWEYRGQVTPSNRLVTTQAVIKASDEGRRWLQADGLLAVDGKVIYRMNDFTLKLLP
jgi:3-hydroxymyristoyl/3-hydroxydecanoyl-(acyl carrier protein) dehydratase